MGESAGGMIAALIALRARENGPALRAQVLNYPSTDWTDSLTDYPSIAENADNPVLSLSRLRASHRLSTPPAFDSRAVSPLMFDTLAGLPPALIVTGGRDPVSDHGRRYAERLRADGTDARSSRYPNASHVFLSTPARRPMPGPLAGKFSTSCAAGCTLPRETRGARSKRLRRSLPAFGLPPHC